MKVIYFITVFYLGFLGIGALFFNYTKIHFFWKLTLFLLAVVATILTLVYQQLEKKTEQERQEHSEMITSNRMQEIKGKLDDLKEKEKRGIFKDTDYLNRIALELDAMNLNLDKREPIIKEQYLTIYFKEVEKIPGFYNFDEWKETEALLFNRILQQLKGYFNARGMLSSGEMQAIEKEFNKEREKYIIAKEREFKK